MNLKSTSWRGRAPAVVLTTAACMTLLVLAISTVLLVPVIRKYLEEEECLDHLAEGTDVEQKAAAERLGALRSVKAVPALLEVMGRTETVNWAIEALVKIGEPGIPLLIEGLSASEEKMRCGAALALGDMGARTAVEELGGVLAQDDKPRVRFCAAVALGNIGPDAIRVLPVIIHGLVDISHDVRSCAALILSRLGKPAATSIPALIQALGDPESKVRIHAAMAVVKLAEGDVVPSDRVRIILREDASSLAGATERTMLELAEVRKTAGL